MLNLNVWAGAPNCHLDILFKLQKQVCRTVGTAVVFFLALLNNHQNVGFPLKRMDLFVVEGPPFILIGS